MGIMRFIRKYSLSLSYSIKNLLPKEEIKFGNAKSFNCDSFENRYQTYVKYVCSHARQPGLWMEFGVATGETTRKYVQLMDAKDKPLYGFDWFRGLPEKWAKHKKGAFSTGGFVPTIDGAEFVVGLFEETLPNFIVQKKSKISVLIIDCDTYSATKTIFDYCGDRLQVGSILIFDEIHNGSGIYSAWANHEYRAFQEFVKNSKIKYEWIAYVENGEQAALRVTAL